MLPEIIRYRIPPERKMAFEAAYTEANKLLHESPHCLGYEMLVSTSDPSLYLLILRWDSESGHLQGFRGSLLFARFLSIVGPFIAYILEMEHYAGCGTPWLRSATNSNLAQQSTAAERNNAETSPRSNTESLHR